MVLLLLFTPNICKEYLMALALVVVILAIMMDSSVVVAVNRCSLHDVDSLAYYEVAQVR